MRPASRHRSDPPFVLHQSGENHQGHFPSGKPRGGNDLTGQTFGFLTVLKLMHPPHSRRWLCRCRCGNVAIAPESYLINGSIRSCGCLRGKNGTAWAVSLDEARSRRSIAADLGANVYSDETHDVESVDRICENLSHGRTVIRGDLPQALRRLWLDRDMFDCADTEDQCGLTLKKEYALLQLSPGYWRISITMSKGHKYHAQKTLYKGEWYDSGREAHWASVFDLLRHAIDLSRRVTRVERQVPFVFGRTGITYRCDFRVTYADTTVAYFEVKGFETPGYKLKMKLMKNFYPTIEIKVVK